MIANSLKDDKYEPHALFNNISKVSNRVMVTKDQYNLIYDHV